jgi:hypothetical protein
LMLGIRSRTLHMLGKCSVTELHTPLLGFLTESLYRAQLASSSCAVLLSFSGELFWKIKLECLGVLIGVVHCHTPVLIPGYLSHQSLGIFAVPEHVYTHTGTHVNI